MKRTVNRFLSSNLSLRILSVILSVCLWMLVINTNDPATTRTFSNVNVDIKNEAVLTDQGMCYRVVEGDKISFSIKGKKSIVDKFKKTDFDVYVDFSELSSVNALPVHIVAKKYADSIDIMNNHDIMMVVHVEKTKTVKLPVEVQIKGKPEGGYSVGEAIATPNAVIITGPESEVDKIASVKVIVDVTGETKDININRTPVCYDKAGNELRSDNLEFSVKKIETKVVIGQSKSVPVKVSTTGSPAAGYQIAMIDCTPAKVQLKGKEEALSKITEITLPEISLEGADESITKEIKASSIKLPKGASFLDPNLLFKVNVLINKEAAQELKLSTDDIRIDGKTDNMKVSFLDDEIVLRFSGTMDENMSLSVANLQPSIDVSGLREGEQKVELKILSITGLVLKESPQIRVNISIDEDAD